MPPTTLTPAEIDERLMWLHRDLMHAPPTARASLKAEIAALKAQRAPAS